MFELSSIWNNGAETELLTKLKVVTWGQQIEISTMGMGDQHQRQPFCLKYNLNIATLILIRRFHLVQTLDIVKNKMEKRWREIGNGERESGKEIKKLFYGTPLTFFY